MFKPSHIAAASLLVLWSPLRGADTNPAVPAGPSSDMLPVPATGEADDLARLHALPANHIPLKGATLASAIRLLAQTARMSYIAPSDAEFSERITSDVMMNPFDLLQVLGDNYGFGMEYGRGVWRFYRVNLNEMVSKAYSIRFNNLQQVTIQSSSINSQLAAAGGSSGGTGAMGGSGGMGGGLGSGSSSSALGGRGTFSSKPDKIIDDIKKILSLPTVGLATPSLDASSSVPGAGADRKAQDAPKVEPIWNPETSQLFVVATRQQHSLISAYLKAVDRPQKLVRIAVKFVETSRNPQQALGVDWSQTFLGSGGPVTLAGNNLQSSNSTTSVFSTVPSAAVNNGTTTTTLTSSGVTNGTVSSSTTNTSGPSGVAGASSSGTTVAGTANALATTVGLGHYFPTTLLSAPAFQWTVQAIATDKYSSIVQDPVIYTTNNREVSFADTTQQPVQQGTTTIGSSTAATTSSIAYIDVGTQLTVLPCILPGGGPSHELVQLNLSINVSSIVGTQVIGGNPYPITSSRTYSYSVSVPAGQTLAIAGLEDRERQTNDSKVPLFGDIPLIGYAFKNKTDSTVRTTLLAFITPELVSTDGPDTEVAAAPLPTLRHRTFQGSPTESLKELDQSLDGLPYDISALEKCASTANKDAVLNRLGQIDIELALMDVRLGELRLADRPTGSEARLVLSDREQLDAARTAVSALRAD
jgi:type II secretory pathway component GspD/PulD (secretin)